MASIRYRPELNPLTTPASYKLRFVHQGIGGYDDIAARLALKNPNWPKDMIKAILMEGHAEIAKMLNEGMQVTLENAFTFRPSLHARLDAPDDQLPPIDKLLEVTVSASQPFIKAVRQNARLERLPPGEKAPVILATEDTVLELNDVLDSAGALRISGSNLAFEKGALGCGCLIEGTRSGSAVQPQLVRITDKEILLVPHIPEQEEAWNNEYTLSISTKYTENGSIRTGIYRRRLRSPLTVDLAHAGESGVGILTGEAESPYVWLTARAGSGAERLRIQAVLNLGSDSLSLSLLAMQEHAAAGAAVNIPDTDIYVLPGFSGSAVSNITVEVSNLTELKALVRSGYQGRMVDILDVVV
jgi:hypothetical protein